MWVVVMSVVRRVIGGFPTRKAADRWLKKWMGNGVKKPTDESYWPEPFSCSC